MGVSVMSVVGALGSQKREVESSERSGALEYGQKVNASALFRQASRAKCAAL